MPPGETLSHEGEEDSPSTGKQQLGLRLPAGLVERARDAVYWTPGLTLNELAEVALTHTLDCMEALRGGPFSPREGPLKVGRRVR